PLALRCLYQMCRALVFPTKFEGFGLPLVEAFSVGVPVTCSAVTCLPEIADGAALLFNPNSPAEMAEALEQIWTDAPLRHRLIERGYIVVSRYSWIHIARSFRAHYRQLLKRTLTTEDRDHLLASDFTGIEEL
ncbi:MAG: glycosyltransferase, partial [Chloroflexi bacterium]|nr:glycosyltransferase [Chloroflexota bacterium]